jgi:hypothetical protein
VIRGELVTQSQLEEINFEIRELKTVKFHKGTALTGRVDRVTTCEVNSAPSGYLTKTDFPLPVFEGASDVNPVCHVKQLDEFIGLRGVQKSYQLAVTYRSIAGVRGR